MTFLDFEQPVAELFTQLEQVKEIAEKGGVDMSATIKDIEKKIDEERKAIYRDLTDWQKVQLSRHPERPYTLFYINEICSQFMELHGDRNVADDKAIVGGLGELDGQTVMFIGHQKGINTKMRQYRNFGMANPEGYRKALRLMKLAEKFGKPIVTLIDTPGAFPGLEAEERGQAEAIARNIYEMIQLRVPVLCIIIGEGASGGALGIGVGDRVLMMEYTWYSVISPESCSSILWRSWDYKEQAASALRLTAPDMMRAKLIDGIIKEPVGGAHARPSEAAQALRKAIIKNLQELEPMDPDKRVVARIRKYDDMGVVKETRSRK
jgi:acetyl-CoA carboxylase carboxyl transferase subunit alpha